MRRFAFRYLFVTVVGAAILIFTSQARAGNNALTTYGDVGQLAIPAIAGVIAIVKEEDSQGLVQLGLTSAVTIGTTIL